jgi:GNAT superfamily N-acetyltransferase
MMSTEVKELKPENFTERLEPIFQHISEEIGEPDRLNSKHFFPQWRRMMELGVARVWETEGAVLGAIFVPELYSGKPRAYCHFWFALPAARGTGRPLELMRAFLAAAKEAGCAEVFSSSHVRSNPEHMFRIYQNEGFSLSEHVFCKKL